MMTDEELIRALQAIERTFDDRIIVVRVVVDMDGKVIKSIYRSVIASPDTYKENK
jgi:hypothetical protein